MTITDSRQFGQNSAVFVVNLPMYVNSLGKDFVELQWRKKRDVMAIAAPREEFHCSQAEPNMNRIKICRAFSKQRLYP